MLGILGSRSVNYVNKIGHFLDCLLPRKWRWELHGKQPGDPVLRYGLLSSRRRLVRQTGRRQLHHVGNIGIIEAPLSGSPCALIPSGPICSNAFRCAAAQFGVETNYPEFVGLGDHGDFDAAGCGWMRANHPHTFGDALKRATVLI